MTLVHGCLVRFLRQVKYEAAPRSRPTTWGDWALAACSGFAVSALVQWQAIGAVLGIALATLLFCLLWLDAALYRIFSFELGVGGVGGAVLSNLYREVMQLGSARHFFSTHRRFVVLPAVALIAHLELLLPQASLPQLALGIALAGYLFSTLVAPSEVAEPADRSMPRRALIHDFLRLRRPRIPANFRPRPEHAALLAQAPALPQPTAQHGVLHGASVVLLTFESLGAAHLVGDETDSQARARTPFVDSLHAAAVRSTHHFCLAPLTNCAHVALYASQPVFPPGASGLSALQQAGYQTLYLTTALTGHYGLADLLRRAGFQHIIDGRLVAPHAEDGGQVSDRALLADGLRRLRALVQADGPFFLHVHAANTHVPYRVADPAQFAHHDARTDRGRFLNSVEESDSIFGELWAALQELGGKSAAAPLLVVSSDHGQSFGEKGYFSHGSAVTHEQLSLPLLLQHAQLAARRVDFSTHFDVLPTILDLVGVRAPAAGLGRSIFDDTRTAGHLLWDGQPSRRTSSCLGLLLGKRKYALDLIRGTCVESDWDDRNPRTLSDEEGRYFEALIGTLAEQQGVQ